MWAASCGVKLAHKRGPKFKTGTGTDGFNTSNSRIKLTMYSFNYSYRHLIGFRTNQIYITKTKDLKSKTAFIF